MAVEYFIDALKQYGNFEGRATRKQFWMYILFYIILYLVCAMIDGMLGTLFLTGAYALGMLVPSVSIVARRLHDIGKSGWWQLLGLLPLLGLVLIYFLVQPSVADNEYGPKRITI